MTKKNIISFSLWCRETQLNPAHCNQHKDVYTYGAIQNTLLAKEFFPGWICRFYVDNTVPDNIIHELEQNGSEIVYINNTNIPGMYWRFLVADDNDVEYAIIRDSDSRLNRRDKMVVDEFINSNKLLHIIRDHPHHKYTILGGMWGINIDKCKLNMKTNIHEFIKKLNRPFKRMDDMVFLDLFFKDLFKYSLIHDNYYYNRYPYSIPFPDYNKSTDYYHYIGEYYDQYDKNQYYERDLNLINNFKFI